MSDFACLAYEQAIGYIGLLTVFVTISGFGLNMAETDYINLLENKNLPLIPVKVLLELPSYLGPG